MHTDSYSAFPLRAGVLASYGDRPALVFSGGRIISYRELAERVERQASLLHGRLGLVSVAAELSEHAIIGYLAAFEAGHAVAMQPPCRTEACGTVFEPEYSYRRFDGRWRLERQEVGQITLHPDLAVVLSTSGSTGQGKSVRLSWKNVAANAQSIAEYLELTASDRACLILPLHYSYGLSVLNAHLLVGASLYIPGVSILDDGFLDGLAASRSTNLSGVPYTYELLEKTNFRRLTFPDLRFMTVAGGRLAPDIVRSYNEHLSASEARFYVMYGQTEATARMAYMPPDCLPGREDRIGIAIPGGSLHLIDEQGRLISEAYKTGELVYRGPNVMMGYACSRKDLARGVELAELRTGDLAERDPSGFFRVVGRSKRISKIAGLRIGHDNLERVLEGLGLTAAVVGDDAKLHAFYEGRQDCEDVRQALVKESGLTLFQVKATRINALPRLASGKIDYQTLRDRMNGELDSDRVTGGVQGLFEQAFYPRKVTQSDSFLSLGGDSLRFVQLSLELERVLGDLPEKWETLQVRELTALPPRETKLPHIGIDLVVRALAILLVVVHHETLWPIPGGAAAMVILVGFGLARFQSGTLLSGSYWRLLRPLPHILLPYYMIVAGYSIAWGEVPWASVFLVGNFGFADPVRHTMVPYLYWFIEAYCQILIVFGLIFVSPFVRRFASADPFKFGMVLLIASVTARLVLPQLWDIGNRQIFTLPWIFYLAVLGWCAAIATTCRQRLTLMLSGAAILLYFGFYDAVWIGTTVKYTFQIAVLAALLFLPHISLPRWTFRLILPLSAAGFHIYILHRFVPEFLLASTQSILSPAAYSVFSIVGGILLGIAVRSAQSMLIDWLLRAKSEKSANVVKPAAPPPEYFQNP